MTYQKPCTETLDSNIDSGKFLKLSYGLLKKLNDSEKKKFLNYKPRAFECPSNKNFIKSVLQKKKKNAAP